MSFRSEVRGGALHLVLERPPRNVLDIPTLRSLAHALDGVERLTEVKALVIRSGLPGVFSAGADVADHAPERVGEMLDAFHGLLHRLDALPQASIAAVDGYCLGGACELAAFCDFTLATPASRFGQPEIDVGCFPPAATALLPRLVGRRAAELILLGEPFDAAKAERIGLVTRVVDNLDHAVADLAERLAAKSAVVLGLARRALRAGREQGFVEALVSAERLYRDELVRTADAREGVKAFLDKRKPRWVDR